MDTRGTHLLVELRGAEPELLNDAQRLESLLVEAATRAGARIVQAAFHRFQPQGVTGFLLLEESHLSIHTWPQQGYAAVDFYTCGTAEPLQAARFLAEALRAEAVECLSVRRGEPSSGHSVDGLAATRVSADALQRSEQGRPRA